MAYKKESFEMFEAMMLRFQEDTLRHLFRMQIIGPDGTPIESIDQLPPGFGGLAEGAPSPRPAMVLRGSAPPAQAREQHTPVPIQTRAPSTTIDALEREFQQKKQRELGPGACGRSRHRRQRQHSTSDRR